MPEPTDIPPTIPTDFERLAAKIDLLVHLQSRTNDLLVQTINNNIAHFNSLKETQNTNRSILASILISERKDLTQLRESVDNNVAWLVNLHDRAQESKSVLEQILSKNVEVVFPTIQIDSGNALLQKILDELKLGTDAGEVRFISDSASTTATIIDFEKNYDPHHPVKAIVVKNDGSTAIDISISSPTTQTKLRVNALESQPIEFNRDLISKLFITAVSGTPAYRMWYAW